MYKVAWSPDGRLLTFNRTNRKQNGTSLRAITRHAFEVASTRVTPRYARIA